MFIYYLQCQYLIIKKIPMGRGGKSRRSTFNMSLLVIIV